MRGECRPRTPCCRSPSRHTPTARRPTDLCPACTDDPSERLQLASAPRRRTDRSDQTDCLAEADCKRHQGPVAAPYPSGHPQHERSSPVCTRSPARWPAPQAWRSAGLSRQGWGRSVPVPRSAPQRRRHSGAALAGRGTRARRLRPWTGEITLSGRLRAGHRRYPSRGLPGGVGRVRAGHPSDAPTFGASEGRRAPPDGYFQCPAKEAARAQRYLNSIGLRPALRGRIAAPRCSEEQALDAPRAEGASGMDPAEPLPEHRRFPTRPHQEAPREDGGGGRRGEGASGIVLADPLTRDRFLEFGATPGGTLTTE